MTAVHETFLLGGAATVLVVHAHPDDETLATGPLLAALGRRGVRIALLTCTRGERGGVTEQFADLAGTPELAVHRERELDAALAALGVRDHAWLGTPPARVVGLPERTYRDSGMEWVTPTVAGPAPDAGPEAFTASDVEEAAADAAAWASELGADALVSYDADGGYHHPDHIHAHHVAKRAAELVGVPFWQVVSEPRGEPFGSSPRPDAVTVTASEDADALLAAHLAHASQFVLDGDDVVHHGGQREPIVRAVRVEPGA